MLINFTTTMNLGYRHRTATLDYILYFGYLITLFLLPGYQAQDTASCYVLGTEHVLTFDGQRIDVISSAACRFTLTYTCPASALVNARFDISIINTVEEDVSKVDCVQIVYPGYTVRLCANQTATVNGIQVVSLLTPNEEIMVYTGTSGVEMSIQTADSSELVIVTMTAESMVRVTVPNSYSRWLCGLCGNFDGDAQNDLVTADGANVSSLSLEVQSAAIAGSYLVPNGVMGCQRAADIIPFYASNCSNSHPIVTSDILDIDFCGVYDSAIFSNCSNVNPGLADMFMLICQFDFCENYLTSELALGLASGCLEEGDCVYNATEAKRAAINVAEVFVDVCRSRGTELSSWRADYSAELSCAGGSVYSFTGPTCPLVCGGRVDNICTETNRDGCECGADLFRDGSGGCVTSEECGCQDPLDGSYHYVGDIWLDTTCSTRFTCNSTNSLLQRQIVCSEFATCSNAAGTYNCTCNVGFDGDGFTCLRQCLEGEQPTSNQAMCEQCPVGTYQPLANQGACLLCPDGLVTSSEGSNAASDCHPIVLVPDTALSTEPCETDVYDQSVDTLVPSNVLPDGLPFGTQLYTDIYASTNGLISFGRSLVGVAPTDIESMTDPVAVPFWFRQDLRGNVPSTKMCRSSYNLIDSDTDKAQESQAALSTISVMLSETSQLNGLDFRPIYAYVVTWHRSIAFPYVWYTPLGANPEYITYQAVVVTDGQNTFLMYIYPFGETYTNLNLNNIGRRISMGYNTQGSVPDSSFSLYLSHTSQITRLNEEESNANVTGRWVFQVAQRGSSNLYEEMCLNWYKDVTPLDISIPCPCNLLLAWFDRRYLTTFTTNCAFSLVREAGLHQMCCYDLLTWQLLTHPLEAGYPVRYLRDIDPVLFESNDRSNFVNCCERSEHCSLFREIMGIPSCLFYWPPVFTMGFGDPHIYTLDGTEYTYNPIGEFWMINSTDFKFQARMAQALDATDSVVSATQFQAVAMKSVAEGFVSDRIHVELNSNRTDFIVYQNDDSLTPLLDSTVSSALIQFTAGFIRKINGSINVVFESGYSFTLSIDRSMLLIESLVPATANGTIQGLLGAFDGDPSNDLTASNGAVCDPSDCNQMQIHEVFGNSWRITQEESLFKYHLGLNTAAYTIESFEPYVLNMSDISADVLAACNNDMRCIYDAVVTDSIEIGMSTKQVYENGLATVAELANVPPYVTGPTRINASIGVPVEVTYTYGDGAGDNDTVSLNVTRMPAGGLIVSTDSNWTMTWTPVDFTAVALSMYAYETDTVVSSRLVSTELNVYFYLSPNCVNGSPDYTRLAAGGTISELFYKVICVCENGWEGEGCENDTDGCADNPCYNANCTDVPAQQQADLGKLYECENITCPVGYTNNYTEECFDEDECVLDSSLCPSGICINTLGSYMCNCFSGYVKVGDQCVDIDECERNFDTCSDLCHNTSGSYYCSCYPGSDLLDDNSTCQVKVSSGLLCGGMYNCSYACANNTEGNEECVCPRTKMVDAADNSSCIAVDECADNQSNACDVSTGAQCEDLLNGYRCTCPIGYSISTSGFTCEVCPVGSYGDDCVQSCNCANRARECNNTHGCTNCHDGWEGDQCKVNIDECNSANACPANSMCADTEGSFRCLCDSGYLPVTLNDQMVCENVDECAAQRPCSINGQCVDTQGSYVCSCMDGYSGDGVICSNINECLEGLDDCLNGIKNCRDETPGYGCFCSQGYHGDGRINGTGCVDDDECLDIANACPVTNSECQNTDGAYMCVCKPFFTGDGDVSCLDIDECETGAHNCSSLSNGNVTCVNIEYGYECNRSCDSGYIRTESAGVFSCVDDNECTDPTICPGGHVTCVNLQGSHDCNCDEFYTKNSEEICVDRNECLLPTECPEEKRRCVNEEPGFTCECLVGHVEPNCDRNTNNTFVMVEQTLDISYDSEWDSTASAAYYNFYNAFVDAASALFNLTGFVGINILSVEMNADDPTRTTVSYEVIYTEKPDDLEHRIYYSLVSNDYLLQFDGQDVRDLKMLKFDGVKWTCDNITCAHNFSCTQTTDEDYPFCPCSGQYSGYNCSEFADPIDNTPGNLLILWISVGIAGGLLAVGLTVCLSYLVIARRRRPSRNLRIHRFSRGPAIFNPSSRLPAEAFNYQFPARSLDSTDSIGSCSSTSRYSNPTGRVGSTMSFAPRWPRAYYSQLDDVDSH